MRHGRTRRQDESSISQRIPISRASNVVFGVLPVLELLRAGSRNVEKIFVNDASREKRVYEVTEMARAKGIPVDRVPRGRIEDLVDRTANHQGVVALTSAGSYIAAEEILSAADGEALLLVLDGIEDPRNLGAIIRTAECAGVDGIFLPERRAVGLTETVAKSSAGAVEHCKIAKTQNLNRLIEELKRRNIWVVGAAGAADLDHTEWDWTRPTALVLGNEGSGLRRLVAENCDVLVKIPMYGKIQSLNVSVAAGVVLFEARRQRAARSAQVS